MKQIMKAPLILLSLVSATAMAHTPYLKPLAFDIQNESVVTLDASFAEKFFVPESAISNANFDVILPNGTKQVVSTVVDLKTRNVLEQPLLDDGTYKFSTGKRFGPVFKMYTLNGERGSVRGDDATLPDGAVLTTSFRPVTNATTYVSKKAPTEVALSPSGDGLEIVLTPHPNDLFNQEPIEFAIYHQGKPLADQKVTVYFAKDQFSEESDQITVNTDNNGKAEFTPKVEGLYLVQTRYRADAPKDAGVMQYSFTATLTLEIY